MLVVVEFEAMTNLGADLQELLDAAAGTAAVQAKLDAVTAERDALQVKVNDAIAADPDDKAVLAKVADLAATLRGQKADAVDHPAGFVPDTAGQPLSPATPAAV